MLAIVRCNELTNLFKMIETFDEIPICMAVAYNDGEKKFCKWYFIFKDKLLFHRMEANFEKPFEKFYQFKVNIANVVQYLNMFDQKKIVRIKIGLCLELLGYDSSKNKLQIRININVLKEPVKMKEMMPDVFCGCSKIYSESLKKIYDSNFRLGNFNDKNCIIKIDRKANNIYRGNIGFFLYNEFKFDESFSVNLQKEVWKYFADKYEVVNMMIAQKSFCLHYKTEFNETYLFQFAKVGIAGRLCNRASYTGTPRV